LLLADTSIRKGEDLALEWDDINFEQESIRINKTLTRGEGNRLIIQPPKTEKSKRSVSIKDNQKLISLLKDWKQEICRQNAITGEKSSYLDFPNANNTIIDPNSINPTLYRIIKSHNLKRLTPHV